VLILETDKVHQRSLYYLYFIRTYNLIVI
jgi:hypothetical protein